jgi:hypothetical protein
MKTLDQIHAEILAETRKDTAKVSPVESWNPALSGDMDLRITREGQWIHQGDPIRREALVKVFSSILKKEGDDYFLVTPVEKWRIQVEDAPFSVVKVEVMQRDGVQVLVFSTSVGDKVAAGPDHPLRVVVNAKGEPSPYLAIRGGMEGLINRPVFYELVGLAEPGPEKNKAVQGVYSLGVFFPLE